MAAVPLGYALSNAAGPAARRIAPAVWLVFGLLLAVAIAALGPAIERAHSIGAEADFLIRLFVRSTALAVGCVTPWLVTGQHQARWRSAAPVLAAGVFVAVLPPLAFAHR